MQSPLTLQYTIVRKREDIANTQAYIPKIQEKQTALNNGILLQSQVDILELDFEEDLSLETSDDVKRFEERLKYKDFRKRLA